MANTVNRSAEKATIDCVLIVLRPDDESIPAVGTDSDTQISVSAETETTDAVRLVIKNVLKAQKKAKTTLTGHTITITEGMTVLDFLPIIQGGKLTRDSEGNVIKYEPPKSGEAVTLPTFVLEAYSAVYSGAELVGYEKVTYPNCSGNTVAPPNSSDGAFRSTDLTISSAPGNGESPYTIEYIGVNELPTLAEAIA